MPTSAFVDGREVGAADEINTPGQWVEVGEVKLSPGEHEIVLARPDSRLAAPATPSAVSSDRWPSSPCAPRGW